MGLLKAWAKKKKNLSMLDSQTYNKVVRGSKKNEIDQSTIL